MDDFLHAMSRKAGSILIAACASLCAGCSTTPLTKAAIKGDFSGVRALLDKGANANETDELGWSPLFAAAYRSKDVRVVKLLVERGADLEAAVARCKRYPKDGEARICLEILEEVGKSRAQRRLEGQDAAKSQAMKEMIKQAVQEAAITRQEGTTPAAVKAADLDKPSFSPSEIIMGESDLAVIIGIEGYQSLPRSDYSDDDARLVAEYAGALGFRPRNIELLLDDRATKSGIEKIVNTWLSNKAKPGSRVFLYYSGHGAPEPNTGEAFLVPYDGDPNYLGDTGYPLKRLYESLARLPSAEVMVVLDACFSGSGGRSVLAKGARPLVMVKEPSMTAPNMVVLAAAQGAQISASSPERGHGIFTYHFLKALKEGKKDLNEIFDHIRPLVEDDAKQMNVLQSPRISPEPGKMRGRFALRK